MVTMIPSRIFQAKRVLFLIILSTSLVSAFEFPQGYGEDHLSIDESSGLEIYARINSQTAWNRLGFTPWSSQHIHGPMSSFEGVLSGRLLPVLQMSAARGEGSFFYMGNEVGDPLYQELKSPKNTNNRTPTIQFQYESPWGLDFGFEQVDHMCVVSSFNRRRRLGVKNEIEKRSQAHAWFGDNFPTSSILYSNFSYDQGNWRHDAAIQKGFIWWNSAEQHPQANLNYGEVPLEINQLNWNGSFRGLKWQHQSVFGFYSFSDSIYDGKVASKDEFVEGSIHQHFTRLGLDSNLEFLSKSYVGGLGQLAYTSQKRNSQSDSIMDAAQPNLFAEAHLETKKWNQLQYETKQTFNDTLYQGRHSLKWTQVLGSWQHQSNLDYNYWTHSNLWMSIAPMSNLNLSYIPHRKLDWVELSHRASRYFGIHVLQFHQEYFHSNPELQSLKESVTFGLHRAHRSKMKIKLSYEHPMGEGWKTEYLIPPQWRYEHHLEFKLPTNLTIQPIYIWHSSYQVNGQKDYLVQARHLLNLRLHQSLLKDRLKAWIEMMNLLGDDRILHPQGQEDRFRAMIGAQYLF